MSLNKFHLRWRRRRSRQNEHECHHRILERARFYDPQLGRFISEDPIGLTGGINQFAYVRNNPQNKIDPSGLYDIDVHYYLTYYLAMSTGCFEDWEARLIAEGDQHSDEDADKKSGWGNKVVTLWGQPAIIPDPEQQARNANFHAFGTVSQNARRAVELFADATRGTGNLWAFGTYLHFRQDSFSHSEYAGNTTWGQSSGVESRDHTSFDPDKAFQMAGATYNDLMKFARVRGCKCSGEPDWRKVREFIEVGYDSSNPWGAAGEYVGTVSDSQLRRKIGILQIPWRSANGR